MSGIEKRARFDIIRYAQVWEDADILLEGLDIQPGDKVLSVCSAGDNVLALLLADPAQVLAVDLSPVQIECLRIRIAAYRTLAHDELLELMGSRPSDRRLELLRQVVETLPAHTWGFWFTQQDGVVAHGLGGIGKFENYFRIFRTKVLPLVHSGSRIDSLLSMKDRDARAKFYDEAWNNLRWRLMLKGFFSKFVMGRLGRDPAFFGYAMGSLSDQVALRTRHALVELDPSQNPYLHWILKGTHGAALPLALREESFEIIRSRLDRVEMAVRPIDLSLREDYGRFDAFNLSDIFEYMDPGLFAHIYADIVDLGNPGARIFYWNMMAARSCPGVLYDKVGRQADVAAALHAKDKAFFYSAVHLEHVL